MWGKSHENRIELNRKTSYKNPLRYIIIKLVLYFTFTHTHTKHTNFLIIDMFVLYCIHFILFYSTLLCENRCYCYSTTVLYSTTQ
jgi:hypothetical protein